MHASEADVAVRAADTAFVNAKGHGIILVIGRGFERVMHAEISMVTLQGDTPEGKTAISRVYEGSMFTDREGIPVEDIMKIVFVPDDLVARILRGADDMFAVLRS